MTTLRISLVAGIVIALAAAEASAAGLLVPRDGSPPIAVRSHRVVAEVVDGLARTTLRQTFVNPYDRPLEALYVFPLPEGAALTHVAMETDGRRLEGLLVERKRARRVYDEIVRSRRDPALVEQVGRDLFRLSVFPVLPGKETVVELTWIEHLPLAGGSFRWVYPLASTSGRAVTDEDLTVTVSFASSVPIATVRASAPDFQIVKKDAQHFVVSLERMRAALTEDLSVTAEVAVDEPTLAVSTWRGATGDGIFLAVVTPPPAREEDLIPRDVILVCDTSGSMSGVKIEQAKAAAGYLLDHLRSADRVNVIRFSSDVQAYADVPVAATAENLAPLREFVDTFVARGGTSIEDALRQALAVPAAPGRVRTVVFLTDGKPTLGEREPVALVEIAKGAVAKGLRIFPFGVGLDVDGGLLRGIAAAGRGRAELFAPGGEVESRLTRFLVRTASPVLGDVDFSVAGIPVHDVLPRPLPDVYLGEQLVVVGRFGRGGKATVHLGATSGDRRIDLARDVVLPAEPGGERAVADLFARTKLGWLEAQHRLRLGLNDAAYYALLEEGAYSTGGEIVDEMISVSLELGVQCPYTSFLVLLPEDVARLDPRDADGIGRALRRVEEESGLRADTGGEGEAEIRTATESVRRPAAPADPSAGLGAAGDSGAGASSGASSAGGAGAFGGGHGKTAKIPVRYPVPESARWIRWWEGHGDEYLAARAAELGTSPSLAPEDREAALAGLRALATGAGMPTEVRAAALVGLGRGGDAADVKILVAAFRESPDLREAALTGLALAGPGDFPEVRELLLETLLDPSLPDPIRMRAALALGLRREGGPEVLKALDRVAFHVDSSLDLSASAFLALGRTGDPEHLAMLAKWCAAHSIGRGPESAWMIAALGSEGGRKQLFALLANADGGNGPEVRAAVAALAIAGHRSDRTVRRAAWTTAWDVAQHEPDGIARCLALLAAGRLADSTEEVERIGQRAQALSGIEGDYATLALGLAAFDAPAERRKVVANEVRIGLVWDSDQAALAAVTLGLARDGSPATVDHLLAILADGKLDAGARAAAATALGLIGDARAVPAIGEALADSEDEDVRVAAAKAAGLLGGDELRWKLRRLLTEAPSDGRAARAAAEALGRVGDAETVRRLLAVATDAKGPAWARALAASAVGRIAARGAGRPEVDWSGCAHPFLPSGDALDGLLRIR